MNSEDVDIQASPDDGPALRDQMRGGIAWNTSGQIALTVIQFVFQLILVRLLVPEDFGAFALAAIVATWLGYILENGFAIPLVQLPKIKDEDCAAALFLNLTASVLGVGILVAASSVIARAFGDATLATPIAVLSLALPVQAGSSVHRALLKRDFDFRGLFVSDLVPALVGGLVAVVLAWRGAGLWSLVGAQLSSEYLTAICLVLAKRWHPTARPTLETLRSLLPSGAHWIGYESSTYLVRNIDNVLVGRFVGVEALGYYTRAFSIAIRPVSQAQVVLGTVLFSGFARLQEVTDLTLMAFTRSFRAVALVATPLLIGLAAGASPVIHVLLGEGWEPAIPLLQILSLAALLQILSAVGSWQMQASGQFRRQFRIGLAVGLLTIGGYCFSAWLGSVTAFAFSHLVGALILLCTTLWAVLKGHETRWRGVLSSALVPICCSLPMAVLLVASQRWALFSQEFLNLAVVGLVGAALYLGLARLLMYEALQDLLGFARGARTPV